ncbi:hypothetical protein ALI144C_36730 [Actinosynnema sp. ALI-1.44]|uniref:hypothetical protein n=1 Tax=Actinosynnema sp. ALI-1.44 TaxID=1933779 RepID=UPI0009C9C9BB|nr:hypothetical protein [Actinosynnema sp. ALI-1.44]ONI76218.1 hypothetical protein ALI144C_36730 [Actinosynnema sp. ALI-1.44]
MRNVKVVVQVKLLPTPAQAAALAATLRGCNMAADRVSVVAFERKVFSRNDLHKLVYPELRAASRTRSNLLTGSVSIGASSTTPPPATA